MKAWGWFMLFILFLVAVGMLVGIISAKVEQMNTDKLKEKIANPQTPGEYSVEYSQSFVTMGTAPTTRLEKINLKAKEGEVIYFKKERELNYFGTPETCIDTYDIENNIQDCNCSSDLPCDKILERIPTIENTLIDIKSSLSFDNIRKRRGCFSGNFYHYLTGYATDFKACFDDDILESYESSYILQNQYEITKWNRI
jgi:hypothetical protein